MVKDKKVKEDKKLKKDALYGEEIEVMNNAKIKKGFDKGIDYEDIKDRLITEFKSLSRKLNDNKIKSSKKKILINKLNYLIIACIQLRNGSRISEACMAFRMFMTNKHFDKEVTVKIAKSDSVRVTKEKEKIKKEARYRNIIFPDWINHKKTSESEETKELLKCKRLKKRTLDYLTKYFECNTHSLRYAYINYMLHVKKIEPNIVAKIVGHINTNMLVTYTQTKHVNEVLNIDP